MNALYDRVSVINCAARKYKDFYFGRICAMRQDQLQIRKIWRGWLLRKFKVCSDENFVSQMCACPFDFNPFTSAGWPFAGGR